MKQTLPLLSLLIERFPDYEREELYSLVLCGDVLVDGGRVRDPKLPVPRGADIRIEGRRFVSRGGDKLDHALSAFGIDVGGKVIIDAGSSTGGFTDCLLKRGRPLCMRWMWGTISSPTSCGTIPGLSFTSVRVSRRFGNSLPGPIWPWPTFRSGP
jgi:hypothetical protein